MIGHRHIETARIAGWKPCAVFLEIGHPPAVQWPWQTPEQQLQREEIPVVWTSGASPELADLRFLRGIRVHVEIREGDPLLFWRWWEAVHDAEPASVHGIDATGEVVTWQA